MRGGRLDPLGTARTDEDGRFALRLRGVARLPVGMRDIFAAAPDGDDFRFLAYVAPRGTPLVVSDVDGTLTHAEGAFPKSVLLGSAVHAQPNAAATLREASEGGYQVVYITARGERFTDATRRWLMEQGFPRGPLRLGRPMFVMPGADTVEYKWGVIVALRRAFGVAAGIGNRASDVEAYRMAGLPARRTFIKLPEFSRELEHALGEHRASASRSTGGSAPAGQPDVRVAVITDAKRTLERDPSGVWTLGLPRLLEAPVAMCRILKPVVWRALCVDNRPQPCASSRLVHPRLRCRLWWRWLVSNNVDANINHPPVDASNNMADSNVPSTAARSMPRWAWMAPPGSTVRSMAAAVPASRPRSARRTSSAATPPTAPSRGWHRSPPISVTAGPRS